VSRPAPIEYTPDGLREVVRTLMEDKDMNVAVVQSIITHAKYVEIGERIGNACAPGGEADRVIEKLRDPAAARVYVRRLLRRFSPFAEILADVLPKGTWRRVGQYGRHEFTTYPPPRWKRWMRDVLLAVPVAIEYRPAAAECVEARKPENERPKPMESTQAAQALPAHEIENGTQTDAVTQPAATREKEDPAPGGDAPAATPDNSARAFVEIVARLKPLEAVAASVLLGGGDNAEVRTALAALADTVRGSTFHKVRENIRSKLKRVAKRWPCLADFESATEAGTDTLVPAFAELAANSDGLNLAAQVMVWGGADRPTAAREIMRVADDAKAMADKMEDHAVARDYCVGVLEKFAPAADVAGEVRRRAPSLRWNYKRPPAMRTRNACGAAGAPAPTARPAATVGNDCGKIVVRTAAGEIVIDACAGRFAITATANGITIAGV